MGLNGFISKEFKKKYAENMKKISKPFSRSLEQFFLTVGKNNFGNKIPYCQGKSKGHILSTTELLWQCLVLYIISFSEQITKPRKRQKRLQCGYGSNALSYLLT